eukprot:TRINITY_DN16248_c2_g1_i1.p1 TRINITY_DN16248_c2_g1~~TRINITY_DN16248_c2_g1_i1.p1  ORF type:complete len:468 (+),score=81.09 TRINITY_DN16248_c2_g1_i1:57-1406(+)
MISLLRGILLLQIILPAKGAASIFNLEEELLYHPWHLCGMFILVIGISVVHEIFFEWLDKQVTSNSGRKLKEHLQHEVMNLGLIGLWLTFIDALRITSKVWSTTLFHYTHFVLFVMMIILMGLTGTLLVTMKIVWKTWVRYERFWRLVIEDEQMPKEQKELTLNIYWDRNQNAKRMINCLKYFNSKLPDKCKDVAFTRYLQKAQRRWLLELLHFNKFTWLSLVAIISLIALVLATNTESLKGNSGLDILYFSFSVGWGTLAILLIVVGKTIRSFRQFCTEIDVTTLSIGNIYRGSDPDPDMSKFFWFGKPQFTIQILQMVLLYQVFYVAIVIVNIVPKANKIALGWVLVISSFVPTIAIFGFLLPMMMPPFTCLANLGGLLNLKLLEEMISTSDRIAVIPRELQVKELNTLELAKVEYAELNSLHSPLSLNSMHSPQEVATTPLLSSPM